MAQDQIIIRIYESTDVSMEIDWHPLGEYTSFITYTYKFKRSQLPAEKLKQKP